MSKFSVAIQDDKWKKLINNTLGDPNRAQRFVASVSSAVAVNLNLQNCDAGSILVGALVGESLNLSPSPQLGHYYLVPYGNKAQFQLGYKGYIQLAIRSGEYRKINVVDIKEDELISFDPLNEEITVNIIDDPLEREQKKTIGYYVMFETVNGFRKSMYWSREKMETHASKYSKAYANKTKKDSFWHKDFDGMAFKTMLRQLISKWGIMSIEMQTAYSKDMAVLDEKGNIQYVDNDNDTPDYIEQKDPVEAELVEDVSKEKKTSLKDV